MGRSDKEDNVSSFRENECYPRTDAQRLYFTTELSSCFSIQIPIRQEQSPGENASSSSPAKFCCKISGRLSVLGLSLYPKKPVNPAFLHVSSTWGHEDPVTLKNVFSWLLGWRATPGWLFPPKSFLTIFSKEYVCTKGMTEQPSLKSVIALMPKHFNTK